MIEQLGCLLVEGRGRVGVGEQLGQKNLLFRRGTSKMWTKSYMGVQVWLITSRHTVPELNEGGITRDRCWGGRWG